MTATPGPRVAVNGLVFSYDFANSKCYAGDSTTNLITTDPTPTGFTNYSAAGGTGDAISYDAAKQAVKWQRNTYEVWGAYIFNTLLFNGTFNTSLQYTASFEWYSESEYSLTTGTFNFEIADGPGLNYVASAGIFANSVSIGGGWYRFSYTFTPPISGTNANFRVIVNDRGTLKTNFWWRKLQLEQKSARTPFVDGSRTASAVDLTNNISAATPTNNPTFNSSNQGSLTFTAASLQRVATSSTTINYSGGTFEMWLKLNAINFDQGFMSHNTGTQYINFWMPGSLNRMRWEVITTGGGTSFVGTTVFTVGTWYHVVGTFNATNTMTLYINGVQENQLTNLTATPVSITSPVVVGDYGFGNFPSSSNISIARIYNRQLSAAEVIQNFNALRGRYGI